MKLIIPIICLITLLSNVIYFIYSSSAERQIYESESLFTYKTPDNEIWVNKDKTALERMRNHYIKGSDSIINGLEAENRKVTPLHDLDQETLNKLRPSRRMSSDFLIFNSLIIVAGFSILYGIAFKRKQTERPAISDHYTTKTNGKDVRLTKPVQAESNALSNNGLILNKAKDIICEILQIITQYSDNNVARDRDSFSDFSNEQVRKIRASQTLDDLLTIEDKINKTIPKHFETIRDLVSVKFNELKAMLHGLANDFGSVTNENTSFSIHIKNSMSRIEKAIELDEIIEIRKKIAHETSALRKAISEKQEKDSRMIESLSQKIRIMNRELVVAKEEVLIDGLTQIYNRKAFERKLSEALSNKSSKKSPFTLVMIDLDYFKRVNDDFGHTIGDEVLKKVSLTIKENFRLNDFVSRYGGEEFVVMIDRIDRHYVMEVCERLRSAIEAINFTIKGKPIPISASIGIAFSRRADTVKTLIDRADKALYIAKEQGRNTIKTEEVISDIKQKLALT